jgi:hypothetical protein
MSLAPLKEFHLNWIMNSFCSHSCLRMHYFICVHLLFWMNSAIKYSIWIKPNATSC